MSIKKERSLRIEFRGKKYSFSIQSLLLYPIGTVILTFILNGILGLRENFWLHEIIAKQVVFLLNLLFNVGAEAVYNPESYFNWSVTIPDSVGVYINNGCTYITSMSIFIAIIIFAPHSKDPKTNEDIIWRKTTGIIISLVLIYIFNIFRITIQVYLYHLGKPWSVVHNSDLTYFIIVMAHLFIFLLCNLKIPEIFIPFYYLGKKTFNYLKEAYREEVNIKKY